jgi:energy-converting hydrogenase B subunit D
VIADLLRVGALLLCALTGVLTVANREPLRQTMVLSMHGLALATFLFVFQAPDVALSQLAVGTVLLPLMALLAIACTSRGGTRR